MKLGEITVFYALKGISVGMCHAIHRHAKENNKYMKDHEPSTEFLYLMMWDMSNL